MAGVPAVGVAAKWNSAITKYINSQPCVYINDIKWRRMMCSYSCSSCHAKVKLSERRAGLDPEALKGDISVKGAWSDETGLVHEVVLLNQNDGAIRASHTSCDRRAPQPTLGAIICQHSWHRIWMLFDPWHTFCKAAVARRRGHGCLPMRLLVSGCFRPTWSSVRWSLNLYKKEKIF